ncbi:hypothetical protein PTKIN_Ptkin04bG0172700 [Pterospermum kingtungense]
MVHLWLSAMGLELWIARKIRDFSSQGYIDGKNDRRLDDCWGYCLVAGRRAPDNANLRSGVLEKLLMQLQITASMQLQITSEEVHEADIMVAGGTEAAILPAGVGGFIACRALSQRNDDPKTASRPWDKDRDGFVMGVVLS